MKLRKLQLKDAPLMLEWMHDEDVIKGLQAEKFRKKELADCIRFISSAEKLEREYHMAITDSDDEYLGTVSLKEIDMEHGDAEFAIVLRKKGQGRGYAGWAMKEIIKMAFDDMGLNEVYWNVLCTNESALRLYENGGYQKLPEIPERWGKKAPKLFHEEIKLIFYHITKEQYEKDKTFS